MIALDFVISGRCRLPCRSWPARRPRLKTGIAVTKVKAPHFEMSETALRACFRSQQHRFRAAT